MDNSDENSSTNTGTTGIVLRMPGYNTFPAQTMDMAVSEATAAIFSGLDLPTTTTTPPPPLPSSISVGLPGKIPLSLNHFGTTETEQQRSDDDHHDQQQEEFRPTISRSLEYCREQILIPYRILLIAIACYRFDMSRVPVCVCLKNSLNVLHVVILVWAICLGHFLTYDSCYRHDGLVGGGSSAGSTNADAMIRIGPLGRMVTRCHDSGITHYLVPSLIHLASYLIILKQIRYCEVDRFHNLCLMNHLLATRIMGNKRAGQRLRKIVRRWLFIVFLFFTYITAILAVRLFWINNVRFSYSFALAAPFQRWPVFHLLSLVLLALVELVNIAIIAIYVLHCQMNRIFIQMTITAIRERRINFQEFARNTEVFKKNIAFLNNRYSISVSLLLIYVSTKESAALIDLYWRYSSTPWYTIAMAGGSILYWTALSLTPLFQAARLTGSCQELGGIGHELSARPFFYQQTSRDDLDSVLTFTSSLDLKARLLMIPIRRTCIISILLVLTFVTMILSQFKFIDI